MSVELLIASYQTAYAESQIDGDDADDWRCRAHEAAEELKGKHVVADVKWPNGRVTQTAGTVISIRDGKVYLESSVGAVEGDAMTMTDG